MKRKLVARREFLVTGQRSLLALAGLNLSGLLNSCSFFDQASIEDWQEVLRQKREGGKGLVYRLEGTAEQNQIPLQVGSEIVAGPLIRVASSSIVWMALEDGSVLKAKGPAKFKMELDKNGSGVLRLIRGSLLNIIQPKRQRLPLLFRGTHAVVGIRGTVFFAHVYGPQDQPDPMAPPGATEYFCLCNGKADYLDPDRDKVLKTDRANHHNSYFVAEDKGGPQFLKAGMLRHSDGEILELIATMKGKKHDRQWIYDAMRDGSYHY